MNESSRDRRALLLLVSLVFYLLLSAFVTGDRVGEIILTLAMYITLIAAALDSSVQKGLRRPALLLAACSMLALLAHNVHPIRTMLGLGWALLAVFFGIVSIGIFLRLGRSGPITNDRLYASVSLYFVMGTFYSALFNFLEVVHPGSFAVAGLPHSAGIPSHALLYFSMATLTTLGYGDVVPVYPPARMIAVLEAATGVLYIAITVARLVSAYQRTSNSEQNDL
jgi:hypothetical protein